jgi:DNA-binding GntR family transcriptional regulator
MTPALPSNPVRGRTRRSRTASTPPETTHGLRPTKLKVSGSIRGIGPDEPLPIAIDFDRKRQVSDQIYDALKRAIVTLKLPPGTAISENRICRHIGASRTPVREAIIRLVEDELIDVYPQQGSFVAPIRIGKIRESHFVRKCLELGVLRNTTSNWSSQCSAHTDLLLRQQQIAQAANDVDWFNELDEDFHRFFSEVAGLSGVWNTIQGAKARVDRVHRLAAIEGRMPMVIKEHRAVVRALHIGNLATAVETLDEHLDKVMTFLDLLVARNAHFFVD